MSEYESYPILFAPDASGVLRHVDEVPNGLACGCTCPDPACGQELVARNAGKKLIHHFAHKRGTCEWSIENVLATLALDAVRRAGCMAFPPLVYHDAMENRDVELSPTRVLRVSDASLEQLSGRGAPELVVTTSARGAEKRFAVVISLIHSLKDHELERLSAVGFDVVLVDLRPSLRARKRAEGKHFDRAAIIAGYQDVGFVRWLMLGEDCRLKSWAANAKRAAAEAESAEKKRIWQAEQDRIAAERERLRREREKAEAERQARLQDEERRLREAQEKELEEQRAAERAQAACFEALRKAEEERRRAEEEAAREEAERRSRIDIMEQVAQQDYQARDAFGRRWARCERCGEVKLVDEFMIYGGPGRMNLGTCYDCGKK